MERLNGFYPPKVNINGDTFDELDSQYEEVAKAARVLIMAMVRARPHGRNYQTVSDPNMFRRSDQVWQAAIDDVIEIESTAVYVRRQMHDDKKGG